MQKERVQCGGESSLWVNLKNQLFVHNMSYRHLYSKPISGMTNIITAVMLNHFSMPRTMFFELIQIWILVFDDFAGP